MSKGIGSLLPVLPSYWAFRNIGGRGGFPSLHAEPSLRLQLPVQDLQRLRAKGEDLQVEEVRQVSSPPWKGAVLVHPERGEPFIRKEIVDIVKVVYECGCGRRSSTSPTNGTFPDTTAARWRRWRGPAESEIIINVSLDELGHSTTRSADQGQLRARDAHLQLAQGDRRPNLTVGIHTVISKFNVDNFPAIYRGSPRWGRTRTSRRSPRKRGRAADPRTGITTDLDQYGRAIDSSCRRWRNKRFEGVARITQAFRLEYYSSRSRRSV